MTVETLKLIVGLGNPGANYANTRHNAGFWFADELVRQHNGTFSHQDKFFGDIARIECGGGDVRVLKPMTFMNESGRSIRALMQFYKIDISEVLVAYDEIDLPPGTIKLKKGGGHGGHNGVRDTIAQASADFIRLRIGVGHPGSKPQVVNYVLGNPSREDAEAIEHTISDALRVIPVLVSDGLQKATHQLHSANKPSKEASVSELRKKPRVNAASEASTNAGNNAAPAAKKKNKKPKTPTTARDEVGLDEPNERASLKDQLMALLKGKQ